MLKTGLYLTLAMGFLVACSDTAPLASTDAQAPAAGKPTRSLRVAGGLKPGMVPIVGDYAGQSGPVSIEPSQPCPEGTTLQAVTVSGIVEPLGQVTGILTSCGFGVEYKYGRFVVTDANGDELHGTFRGRNTAFNLDQTPANVVFNGVNKITGGTGRYENASGTLAHTGVATVIAQGVFDLTYVWDGLILIPGDVE